MTAAAAPAVEWRSGRLILQGCEVWTVIAEGTHGEHLGVDFSGEVSKGLWERENQESWVLSGLALHWEVGGSERAENEEHQQSRN